MRHSSRSLFDGPQAWSTDASHLLKNSLKVTYAALSNDQLNVERVEYQHSRMKNSREHYPQLK